MTNFRIPPLPQGATTSFPVGRAYVATSYYPGRPQTHWEPGEPAELGDVYLLLPSKGRWVLVDLERAPHLEDQVCEALWKQQHQEDDGYAEEMEKVGELISEAKEDAGYCGGLWL